MGKKVRLMSSFQKRRIKFANKNVPKLKKQNSVKVKSALSTLKHGTNGAAKNGVLFSKRAIADELSRAHEEDYDLEEKYEEQQARAPKTNKNKLPIKTKQGFVRVVEVADELETCLNEIEDQNPEDETSDEEDTDVVSAPKVVTATHLLCAQNKILEAKKIQVGSLSSSILENPNEKIYNFRILFNLMNENETGDFVTVKKIVIISLLEVFKDLLPSYQLKQTIDKGVKLKKETLKLDKYETMLLQYYKKFLQILERFSLILIKKQSRGSEAERKLGELSVSALCDLLHAHTYFNYAENIAQTVVPFLNHPKHSIRQKVSVTCKEIFKEDKKGEITLKILKLVNQSLKKYSFNVNTDMLEILLFLKIKDVNINQERDQKFKQKKLMSHKSNVLQLSKNERKKKARLQELEKALLEAKAEENKQSKQKCHAEITKVAFGIFFKMLKNCTNTKVVGVCLQGIAKFAHCINIEFYVDLINILDSLLKADWLGYCEQQRCIQTIFVILNEQEVLNLDPIRFYTSIYENLLTIHASKNYNDFIVVLETLIYSLIRRHKKITVKRMTSFLKRITTLSLQLLHNGTLACLGITKSLLQLNKAIDVLLDVESSSGSGPYLPELNDPEYCNASSTALFELALLNRHYHPTVGKYSNYVALGAPASVGNNLSCEFGRTNADQLFNTYDMSQMCFYPSIPVLKKVDRKTRLKNHHFSDVSFKRKCVYVIKKRIKNKNDCLIDSC